MKLLRLGCLFASAAPLWAGLNSAVIVLPSETGRTAPAICIVQPADYLCAIVTLRTTARDTDRQSAAMRESLQRLTNALQKSPRFQLHQGALRYAGNSSSVYSSKAGSGPASLQTTLRVLSPLQGDIDVFESMRQLRVFLASLAPANDT